MEHTQKGENMPLITLKCNSCGGDISFDSSKDIGFCPYCGSKFIKENTINNYTMNITNTFKDANVTIAGDDVEKVLNTADAFLQLGEYATAKKKYQEIINKYPLEHRGWWGSALAQMYLLRRDVPIKVPDEGELEHSLQCYEAGCRCVETYYNRALSMCKDDSIRQQINKDFGNFIKERDRAISDYKHQKSSEERKRKEKRDAKSKNRAIAWVVAFFIIYIPIIIIFYSMTEDLIGSVTIGFIVAIILFVIGIPFTGSIIVGFID